MEQYDYHEAVLDDIRVALTEPECRQIIHTYETRAPGKDANTTARSATPTSQLSTLVDPTRPVTL